MGMPPLPLLTEIESPLAEERIPYRSTDGIDRTFRVIVGKPVKHWSGETVDVWFCPVYFEHQKQGIKCIRGVGPVSALANAGVWINATCQRLSDGTLDQK